MPTLREMREAQPSLRTRWNGFKMGAAVAIWGLWRPGRTLVDLVLTMMKQAENRGQLVEGLCMANVNLHLLKYGIEHHLKMNPDCHAAEKKAFDEMKPKLDIACAMGEQMAKAFAESETGDQEHVEGVDDEGHRTHTA